MKRIVLLFFIFLPIVSCKETVMAVDPKNIFYYEVENGLDVQFTLKSYRDGNASSAVLMPGEIYSYWEDPSMGFVEQGKILVGLSDSLDIYFSEDMLLRLYSTRFAETGSRYLIINWENLDGRTRRIVVNNDMKAMVQSLK
ncbi:MAG: hypothetical protein NC115_11660 [Bacteroidales bacterium]|nr:hypothetical protein [Bacteroidales bacterium]